jgi:CBS domain-containing protein
MDRVGDFCSRALVTATLDASVKDAAHLMRTHHVGAVVVVDGHDAPRRPLGLVTDRDIVVEVVAAGLAPDAVRVSAIVRRSPIVVNEGASCAEAIRLMAVNGIRRIPVVDNQGALVGIVSYDDVMVQWVGPLVALSDLAGRERSFEKHTRT